MEDEDHYRWKRRSWLEQKITKIKKITTTPTTTTTRRKAWITASTILSFFIIIMNVLTLGSAEGSVGCHFVKSLCLENIEFCYDDYAFGKCLSKSGVEQEDLDRTTLTEEQSSILATMLEEMQGAGLGWDHPFVQCRIQGALFSMRRNTPLPPNLCANLAPDPEILDPQSPLAFVRFTPPSEDYADELYYPPFKKGFDDRLYVHSQPISQSLQLHHHSSAPLSSSSSSSPSSLSSRPNNIELLQELTEPELLFDDDYERLMEKNRVNQKLANRIKDIKDRIELRRMIEEYKHEREREREHERELHSPSRYVNNEFYPSGNIPFDAMPIETFNEFKDTYKRGRMYDVEDEIEQNDGDSELPSTFFREMANNQRIHLNPNKEYANYYRRNPLEIIIPAYRNKDLGEDETIDDSMFAMNTYPVKYPNKKTHSSDSSSGVYTEGGLVYVPERTSSEQAAYDRKEERRNMLADMLGFTRHERLDVKKPGPLIGPPPQEHMLNKSDETQTSKTPTVNKAETKEVLPAHIKGSQAKKATQVHSDEDHAPHTVDTEYAHVYLKNPVDNWKDGSRIVTALGDILHMQPYFTHTRVDRHEVSFRVEPNPERKTAVDVARAINDPRTKTNLFRRLGVTVAQAGVGDKIKSDTDSVSASKLELAEEGPDVTHIMAYMFAGAGAAAIIVIVITLSLIRRHDQKKDKLGGLQTGLSATESCSRDYQDLCRARMAGKGASETISSGRITSLAKESDRPPSSRSSTSSWSEEPALTNMDISTGHMVLSYMEDHLRNKGRLQREWEALCRYEAEPSAREAALQAQCGPLNRPGAPLPFDHSRVVLNHLANAEGLDYVNASTITDHDPRAPAYVAAQGPLPTTLAHFWQMIWEQGAVIIVALCRLQENGEVACARYWPEEGAEVYHIYEVHLVSEHIWCDDYLVRSFYLKNLRTSETRTVTQFHFLSWPQGGIPSSAKALLEFRRKVNKSYRGRSCPIVVHGSHGAGRTGAYILLDLVLGRMNKGAREIDIAATLEHLRDQRAGLVATRQQFEFVLMAVAEEVHAILKALPANTQSTEKRDLEKEPTVKEEETVKDEQQEKKKQVKTNDATPEKGAIEKSKEKKDSK